MKNFKKRLLAIITLVAVVTTAVMPSFATEFPETAQSTTEASQFTAEELASGIIYIDSRGELCPESGEVTIDILRGGNTEGAASVGLFSIDMSAKIKEDYDFVGSDIFYGEDIPTVMERNAYNDANKTAEEFVNQVNTLKDEVAEELSDETEETSALEELADGDVGVNPAAMMAGAITDSLEATPEEQERYGEEAAAVMEYAESNAAEYLAYSAVTYIEFAPGEAKKQITVEIKEDTVPEDDEVFILMLSNVTGAVINNATKTATVTIVDDEENEPAYVSFISSDYYVNKDNTQIKLVRSGADYTMVSADIILTNGDRQTVFFNPYETEAYVDMNFEGTSASTVMQLDNFKGCEAGEIDEAVLYASTKYTARAMLRTSMEEEVVMCPPGLKDHNGGNRIEVRYVPGQVDEYGRLYGKIYDAAFEPEVWVGNYYFPSSFEYDLHTGDTNVSQCDSEYRNSDKYVTNNSPDGIGYLSYYSALTWNKGSSYAECKNMKHHLYTYYAFDLDQTASWGTDPLTKSTVDYDSYEINNNSIGKFNRKTINVSTLNSEHAVPEHTEGCVRVAAIDNSGYTPEINIRLYGVAAMFRRFDIKLGAPAELEFKNGDGTTYKKRPAQPALATGHDERYLNQSLSIMGTSNDTDGSINGQLIGYKVRTNYKDYENSKVFYYMANGYKPEDDSSGAAPEADAKVYHVNSNLLTNIPIDEAFVNMVDENLSAIDNFEQGDATHWSTELEFTPIYQYKNVDIRVISSDKGSFDSADLTVDVHRGVYHMGDEIMLGGIPNTNEYLYSGAYVEGRPTYNYNDIRYINEILVSEDTKPVRLKLGQYNCSFYVLTPQFVENKGNYIQFDSKTNLDGLTVPVLSKEQLAVLENSEKYKSYGFNQNMKIFIANPTEDVSTDVTGLDEADKLMNMITVKPGKIYKIEVIVNKEGYRPKFKNNYYYPEEVFNSNIYYFTAQDNCEKNTISLDAVPYDVNGIKPLKLTGKLQNATYIIRQSTELNELAPAYETRVYTPAGQSYMWRNIDIEGNEYIPGQKDFPISVTTAAELQDALNKAATKITFIRLDADITTDMIITSNTNNVILDLNGHTITFTGEGQLKAENTDIALENGIIQGEKTAVYIDYSFSTLENMEIISQNDTAVFSNGGRTYIKNCYLKTMAEDTYALNYSYFMPVFYSSRFETAAGDALPIPTDAELLAAFEKIGMGTVTDSGYSDWWKNAPTLRIRYIRLKNKIETRATEVSGTGTIKDPYVVCNEQQLIDKLGFNGTVYIKLGANIDITGECYRESAYSSPAAHINLNGYTLKFKPQSFISCQKGADIDITNGFIESFTTPLLGAGKITLENVNITTSYDSCVISSGIFYAENCYFETGSYGLPACKSILGDVDCTYCEMVSNSNAYDYSRALKVYLDGANAKEKCAVPSYNGGYDSSWESERYTDEGIDFTGSGLKPELTKQTYVRELLEETKKDGTFTFTGIPVMENDSIMVYYENGDVEGVAVYKLEKLDAKYAELTYIKPATDDYNKNNYDASVTEEGIYADASQIKTVLPVGTTGSPYIWEVEYLYGSYKNNEQYDTRDNAVAIAAGDFLEVTARINPMGHNIRAAVFVIDKKIGKDLKFEVQSDYKNQVAYRCDFNGLDMDKNFEPGDRLYVYLVDADTKEYTYAVTDKKTNKTEYESEFRYIKYSTVYTGLSFYVPQREAVLQRFEMPESPFGLDAPIVGRIVPSVNSGVLSFSKTEWENGGVQGFSRTFDANVHIMGIPAASTMDKIGVIKNTGKKTAEEYEKRMKALAKEATKEATEQAKKDAYKKSYAEVFEKKLMSLNVVVIVNFDYIYSDLTGGYVMCGGQIGIGGLFAIVKSFYTAISSVPLFIRLTGRVNVEVSVNYSEKEHITPEKFSEFENIMEGLSTDSAADLFVYLSGRLDAGVGLCGVLSARGIIMLEISAMVKFEDMAYDSYGFLLKGSGGFGIDLVLFSFEYMWTIGQVGTGMFENMTGWGDGKSSNMRLKGVSDGIAPSGFRLLGGGSNSPRRRSLVPNGYTVVAADAAERTRPEVVELPNGNKFMVFINGGEAEMPLSTEKVPQLYYSIGDSDGNWSDAVLVENDGTADSLPALEVVGNDVIILWSDAVAPFSDEDYTNLSGLDYAKKMLSGFDISAAIWDGESRAVTDVFKVTDESGDAAYQYMDYGVDITKYLNEDNTEEIAVFYKQRDTLSAIGDTDLVNIANDKVILKIIDTEQNTLKQTTAIDSEGFLMNFDAEVMKLNIGTDTHKFAICSYIVDGDKNIETSEDWDVYLLFYDIGENKMYNPINITDDYAGDIQPKLSVIGTDTDSYERTDNIYLSWVSKTRRTTDSEVETKFKYMNISSVLERIAAQYADRENVVQTLHDISTEIIHKHINSVDMSSEANSESLFSDYKLMEGADGNVYLLWTDQGSDEAEDLSIELYGAMLYHPTEGNRGGWSKAVKLTEFAKAVPNTVIDEFTASVDKNGDFTLLGNMYTREMAGDNLIYSSNNLVAFSFDNSAVIKTDEASVKFSSEYPLPKSNESISFEIKNIGLMPIEGYNAVVEIDGVTFAEISSGDTIFGGETVTLTANGVMPDTIGGNTPVVITVTEPKSGQTDTVQTVVPYGYSLEFATKSFELGADGAVKYMLEVFNTGNKASENITLKLQQCKNGLGKVGEITQTNVQPIEGGENVTIEVDLPSDTLSISDFSKFGVAQLGIDAYEDGNEEAVSSSVEMLADKDLARLISINGVYKNLEIEYGEDLKLDIRTTPITGETNYTYVTDRPEIVAVDDINHLKGLKAGTAQLTVTETVSGTTATFEVEVTPAELTVVQKPLASDITSGSKLSASTLTGGKVTCKGKEVSGTWVWAADKTMANVGIGYEKAVFVPDLANYMEGSGVAYVEVDVKSVSTSSSGSGSASKTETTADGTKITTKTDKDKTVTTMKYTDGSVVTITEKKDGTTTIKTDIKGTAIKEVVVKDSGAQSSMVLVRKNSDGTEEIIKTTALKDGKIVAKLGGQTELKLIDNSKVFEDVEQSSWYYNAVSFAAARDILNGTDTNLFEPELDMSRGMFAQMLYNIEGRPEVGGEAVFNDIKGHWAEKAVIWAANKGIVNGTGNGLFGVDESITREQIAAMLYRYAGSPAADGTLKGFEDSDEVSDYTIDALIWATKTGLIKGVTEVTLEPSANATRAQVATMMMRYVNNIMNQAY